jgi:hypothetical protein
MGWQAQKTAEEYLETEQHGFRDAADRLRRKRDEEERQIELDLFNERREGTNWLENRGMRMSALMLEYQRTFIAAQIDIRTKLGIECPELVSDAQLVMLQETMLHTVQLVRRVRREDYRRRAQAAGIPMRRSEQKDAAAYGNLEEQVRREIRKLELARSLGRFRSHRA